MYKNIDRRQFLIGPRPIKIKEDWQTLKINKHRYLSYCNTLPIKVFESPIGEKNIILGSVIQTNENKVSPIQQLKQMKKGSNLNDIYCDWAGRWILFNEYELHLDPCGLLGCFYIKQEGELWVSSSLNVLSEVIGINKRLPLETAKLPEGIMSWYPLPCTELNGVKSLLPTQTLSLKTGEVKDRMLFPKELFLETNEESLEVIVKYLTNGILNLFKNNKGKTIWIPLSAGYDSRLLIAIALKAKIPFKTYTMKKKNRWDISKKVPMTSPVSKADMILPPLIAKLIKVEHRFIEEEKFNIEKYKRFVKHTSNRVIENDIVYYSKGQWDWITKNDIVLLGQVSEIGSRPYYDRFKNSKYTINYNVVKNAFLLKDNSYHENTIKEYLLHLENYINKVESSVNWRDYFYIEQRFGGWLSSNQQSLDLLDGEKIHLANSQRIVCALLSLSKEYYKDKEFIKKIIENLAPELLEIPINPKDPLLYSINKKISNISRQPHPIRFILGKIKNKCNN